MGIKKTVFRRGKATLGSISSESTKILSWYVSHYSSVSFKDSHHTSVMSISCFFANTKNFSYPWSPYIFEYMMTANHPLFEKDGVFWFHISTCHLEQLVAVAEDMFSLYSTDRLIAVYVHFAYVPRAIHVGRGFIFGAYPLLGACLLTTYAHKCIRLLTRVYGTDLYQGIY